MDPGSEDRLGAAFRVHQAHTDEVMKQADPREIKKLYVELGSLLEGALGDEPEGTPVLSFKEIGPAIEPLLRSLGRRVLDAGCGPNPAYSILTARQAPRTVVSLDIAEGIVRLAVDVARSHGVVVHGVVGDLEALPFRDGAFDGCVCEDTIEHIPDDALAIRELDRVLTNGGRLVLGTPNRIRADVLRARLRDAVRRTRKPASAYFEASSHLREYTWRTLTRLIASDFDVRRRVTIGWTGGWRSALVTRLVRHWPLKAFGRMVILDLEKRS